MLFRYTIFLLLTFDVDYFILCPLTPPIELLLTEIKCMPFIIVTVTIWRLLLTITQLTITQLDFRQKRETGQESIHFCILIYQSQNREKIELKIYFSEASSVGEPHVNIIANNVLSCDNYVDKCHAFDFR